MSKLYDLQYLRRLTEILKQELKLYEALKEGEPFSRCFELTKFSGGGYYNLNIEEVASCLDKGLDIRQAWIDKVSKEVDATKLKIKALIDEHDNLVKALNSSNIEAARLLI